MAKEMKTERYNRKNMRATELADALEREKAAGWIVYSAENDEDDYVITFEKEN